MKTFIIEESLAQEILNYLASRPYIEVHEIIQKLRAIQPVPEPKPDAKE